MSDLDWPTPEQVVDDWPTPEPLVDDWPDPEQATADDASILDQPAGTPGSLDCGCDAAMVITTGDHLRDCEADQ